MKILITGGLGYVGGRIAEYFRKVDPDRDIVLGVWKGSESLPQWTKEFTVVPLELLDEGSVKECVSNSGADCIIHLAALNEIDSGADPDLAYEVNCRGTERLLQAANEEGVKKFIYFSTFHVYGKDPGPVITEQTPARATHPYASTHLAAEEVVRSFRDKGMDTLIFRLSNSYGYPEDKEVNRWTLVVNDLCRQAVIENRIVLKSSGRQCRDFIALSDVVRAVHHFLFNIPEAWGDGLYNLGGNCTMSILEVAEKISGLYYDKYGKKIAVERKSAGSPADGTRSIVFSIDRLMKTGFVPEGDMDGEIAKTMEICEGFLK